MDLKKEAARKAASLVVDNTVVGLGAGSTIAHLVGFLKESTGEGLEVKFVTSSFSTWHLLQSNKMSVSTIASFNEIDVYFDGCDQMDKQLNALKSGGGIHTQEKLLASMAREFILVGDESKVVDEFDTKYPIVIEMLPQAVSYVPNQISQLFNGTRSVMRMNDKKDGPVMTENGNYLIDVYFEQFPEIAQVNPAFKTITGIVETSLFFNIAQKAIIAGSGGIRVLEK